MPLNLNVNNDSDANDSASTYDAQDSKEQQKVCDSHKYSNRRDDAIEHKPILKPL